MIVSRRFQKDKRVARVLWLLGLAYAGVVLGFLHAVVPHHGLHRALNALAEFGTARPPHEEVVSPGGGFGSGAGYARPRPVLAALPAPRGEVPTGRVIHADVVALEQPLVYNRFGSVNPYGMIYALRRDVEAVGPADEWLPGLSCPGRARLREHRRPRPLVLRGNVGDTLELTFTNLLLERQPDLSRCRLVNPGSPYRNLLAARPAVEGESEGLSASGDWPFTRTASLTVQGMTPLDGSDPRCVGIVPVQPEPQAELGRVLSGAPGQHTLTCRWKLTQAGAFMFYSHGAPAGGNGDGGSLTHGLFGSLNVEPAGSQWYRSQVTRRELDAVWARRDETNPADGVRRGALDYNAENAQGVPVLNLLDERAGGPGGGPRHFDLVYGDLNALVLEAEPTRPHYPDENSFQAALSRYREAPAFREFTALFHDELKTFYADPFTALEQHDQLQGVGDGFGINYGASGMGSVLVANRKGIGPSWNCIVCLYEEFFLQSWANGDAALLEEYADDPSNVYHSYLNDRVVFRNLHAGPKETHVFHLHAHQWLSPSDEDRGSYLDSQTIGPLQSFAYAIYNGGLRNHGGTAHHQTQGSGNRNRTPGDSIFHCHLYPHFAQGMWSLWRVHDVLEDGTRRLPDGQPRPGLSTFVVPEGSRVRSGTDPARGPTIRGGQIADAGTPVPAVVPLPGQGLPPLPTYGTKGMPGYPFYIPGRAGHRAPQPPLDFAREGGVWQDAGLPRHVFGQATRAVAGLSVAETEAAAPDDLLKRSLALGDFSAHLEQAELVLLDNEGEAIERRAMAFHAGQPDLDGDGVADFVSKNVYNRTPFGVQHAQKGSYLSQTPDGTSALFTVNGARPQPGAPFADPCDDPARTGTRRYDVSAVGLDLIVNKAGWHDPQARINVLGSEVEGVEGRRTNEAEPLFFRAASGECVEFFHTNRTPKDLERDDFQVKTPTDIIGQHIHLVKFDVTSSDGSANGWNYEDGTLAADAVLERQCAANHLARSRGRPEPFTSLSIACPPAGSDPHKTFRALLEADTPTKPTLQTTSQRWFADPILSVNREPGQGPDQNAWWMGHRPPPGATDRTLRTVFTHDHFAPSSIQQHGFYSALLIEPAGSKWLTPDGRAMPPQAAGWQAVIRGAKDGLSHPDHREFALAVADFALLYDPRHAPHDPEVQGVGRLLCEAVALGRLTLPESDWFCPSRELAEIAKAVEAGLTLNAEVLSNADVAALLGAATANWREHGRPVDPPEKPEAISAEHHNPYLVNYRHEPLPLRLGELTLGGEPLTGDLTRCGQDRVFDRDPAGRFRRAESVRRQRAGADGDPAFVFSSGALLDPAGRPLLAGHTDPCTPILEAYEGERVQIRLIQGAQEVQHMFTVEGLNWPRLPDKDVVARARLRRAGGSDRESLQKVNDLRRAKVDNVDALVSTQEVGISEHFEALMPPFRRVGGGRTTTDYLYHFGSTDALWNGAWGLIRSYDHAAVDDPDAARRGCDTSADTRGCKIGDRVVPLFGRGEEASRNAPDPGHIKIANREAVLSDDPEKRKVFLPNGREAPELPPEAENFCFDGSVYRAFEAVATRADLLYDGGRVYYDRSQGIFDPDGLILLPLRPGDPKNWRALVAVLRQRYGARARRGDLEPLVVRVNAGDCVYLEVYNALLAPGERGAGLPDARGDALMPRIVPLNVERTPAGDRDLTPSGRLSLSVPLVYSDVAVNGGLAFGRNLDDLPADSGREGLERVALAFYAGKAELEPEFRTPAGQPTCPEVGPCPFNLNVTPYAFGPVPIKAFGDVLGHGAHGLIGAVIVEPQGAEVFRPDALDRPVEGHGRAALGLEAVVRYRLETLLENRERDDLDLGDAERYRACEKTGCPAATREFREFVVFYQDGLNLHAPDRETYRSRPVADCFVCGDSYDLGEKGVSYRTAPFWARLPRGPASSSNLNQYEFPTDFFLQKFRAYPTPTFHARAGEEVRFRVLQPSGRARQRAFVVYGHTYDDMLPQFGSPSSALMSAGKSLTATLRGPDLNGDGQPDGVRPGCYLYRDGPAQLFAGGVWGGFIVSSELGMLPPCAYPELQVGE